MITLVENSISTEEYLKLRAAVQWRELSENQAIQVINNSLFFVKAVDDCGNVVGMGRIVGDGAVVCYIQDLIVLPDMQGKNIGSLLIKRLIAFVNELREENTTLMLCLMCAKGREKFYEKHGFIARPNDMLGPGMIQYLQD
ncbi:MAG: GNAT family N-acetyltransferase [Lachnospiraceae bacterium]|nr:GNAT family N-acetyltransferase [Lachnospiraceae bacterium]